MSKEGKKELVKIGKVKSLEITDEMRDSYIRYAMSVIVARALPDVRDGLKPVQRRILYSMYEMGLRSNSRFRKSATVTGDVLGKYHPHGDAAIYGALARMAQDFSLRYPLIQPQGNFGSLDGDSPAAPRYTECRLSKIGEAMLRDIEKGTVDFLDNYDGTRQEPLVLPGPFPQLLLNGCLGIAVGMATKIPPHNFIEVCNAVIYSIDHPKARTEDLFSFIQGPDFPTGGIIYDKKEILSAYSEGSGSILIRGKADIIESKNGFKIIISEIPFGVQKSSLLQQIAKLVQEQKIRKVRDIRDESDKDGLRVVIDLKEGAYPKKILNFLYKHTSFQTTFYLNMVGLIDGLQPKVLSLAEIIQEFIKHRKIVILRRTKFEKEKAMARLHILEGFYKALQHIDAVIETIKSSQDRADAKKNLMKKFKLTEIQANAILDMKLSSLARLEQKKIESELNETKLRLKELCSIIDDSKEIEKIIKKELKEGIEKFGDKRKTKVFSRKAGEISVQDLVPQEQTVVVVTQKGLIKRLKPSVYRVQKRGGRGVLAAKTKEEDFIKHLIFANTHDDLLFFTDSGKVFKTKVYEIPETKRLSKGKSLLNFLELSSEEKVLAITSLPETKNPAGYFVMATKNGLVKKTRIIDFQNVRRTGLIAIKLNKGDLLRIVCQCKEKDEIILTSKKGKSIRFKHLDVRQTNRASSGVRGIRLSKGDEVIGMEVIIGKEQSQKGCLLVVTENGYGKRTEISKYRTQQRGGSGIKTLNITKKTGDLIVSKFLRGTEEFLILISKDAQVIKMQVSSISKMGRNTQGVRIIKLRDNDKVASIACS